MVGSLLDIITYAKFQVVIFGGCDFTGVKFPIFLLIFALALQQSSATALSALPVIADVRTLYNTSSSGIAERPRCRVGYLWPKVKDWNWETIFTDILGLSSTTVTHLAIKETKIREKNAK